MQIWMTLILAVQLLSALTMIGLVLIQHGKGADMGASFGSGASGSLFGATGSANFLSRATAGCATLFFACTLALAYLGNLNSLRTGTGTSVLDRPSSSASAPATGVIPGAVPGATAPVTPAVAPAAPAGVPAPMVTPTPTPAAAPVVPAPAATGSSPK
jgi:preprotein translocase subunit SecG